MYSLDESVRTEYFDLVASTCDGIRHAGTVRKAFCLIIII